MKAAYFEAAIPEPYRILGLKLRPFSIGHYILLSRFNCAFVCEKDARASIDDLFLGVLVCSMTFEEFLPFLDRKDFDKQILNWGMKVGEFDFKAKAQLFIDYIGKAIQEPEYWHENEESGESGAHWSQAVMTTLMGALGYTRSQALNCPLPQALADFYKHAENLGLVTLVSAEEAEEIRELEAAAATKEGAENGS